jgi:hypothetical protein
MRVRARVRVRVCVCALQCAPIVLGAYRTTLRRGATVRCAFRCAVRCSLQVDEINNASLAKLRCAPMEHWSCQPIAPSGATRRSLNVAQYTAKDFQQQSGAPATAASGAATMGRGGYGKGGGAWTVDLLKDCMALQKLQLKVGAQVQPFEPQEAPVEFRWNLASTAEYRVVPR